MNDKRYNIVFIGRSGCGKGTQAGLLKNVLEKKYGSSSALYVSTGDQLRNLKDHQEFYTARLVDEKVFNAGGKAPGALGIWAWTEEFIHGITENNHVIVDGAPRTAAEAQIMDEMFDFYGRKNIFHIYLSTSAEWVFERMMARGRFDDNPDNIKNRMAYYEKYVVPAIEYYKNDSKHKFIEVNGEQSIEKVHADIVSALWL